MSLLVEDSRDVGQAVKALLELCGATVAGPAATIADAEVLLGAVFRTYLSLISTFEGANDLIA
jgi:hypothetical protein